jgi:ABC-type phosphonate transport system ATPase subunit
MGLTLREQDRQLLAQADAGIVVIGNVEGLRARVNGGAEYMRAAIKDAIDRRTPASIKAMSCDCENGMCASCCE